MNKKEIFKIIKSYLEEKGAKKIAIFGSYARGEAKQNSDIDIVVEFSKPVSFLDLVHMENELYDLIKIKVDLLTKNSISHYIKKIIEKDLIYL